MTLKVANYIIWVPQGVEGMVEELMLLNELLVMRYRSIQGADLFILLCSICNLWVMARLGVNEEVFE